MQRVIGHIRDINSIGDEKISIFFLFDRLGGLAPSVCDGFFLFKNVGVYALDRKE